jgi:hypothetical protein
MRIHRTRKRAARRGTQLNLIRDLMVVAAAGGAWLTLHEIAERTEFAEASISAQLRHLRKQRHGNYCVEKRPRRQLRPNGGAGCAVCQGAVWEYCIVRPEGAAQIKREFASKSCGCKTTESGGGACQNV